MPRRYVTAQERQIVAEREIVASTASPADLATQSFSVEHIIPVSHGGETALDNLALACPGCNGHKYTRTEAPDPVDGTVVPLYNHNCSVQEATMVITDRIQQYVQRLPASFQVEVLDFVEYLLAKAEREEARQEEKDWSDLSLSFAMRGMEGEDTPTYTTGDLKVVFS